MVKVNFPASVLKPIKKHLKKEKKKLKKRKKELEEADPFQDPERLNDNTVDADAKEKVGHQRVSALKKEINRNLVEIKKALTKIKVGDYGLCEDCGHMIDTDRLAAKPTADLCMKCLKKKQSEGK